MNKKVNDIEQCEITYMMHGTPGAHCTHTLKITEDELLLLIPINESGTENEN